MILDQRVAALIREITKTEILPRFGNLQDGEMREKSPNQWVTDADLMAEQAFAKELPQIFDAVVVGEEGTDSNPESLLALEKKSAVWLVDPVDGTGNFAKGNPRFAVIIALVIKGVTQKGWIYDPQTDRMFYAEKDQGVWLDQTRLKVRKPVTLSEMIGSVKYGDSIRPFVSKVSRLGSAAHDYLDLITGVTHFCHFGGQLMPWDHAAGVLFHCEANGYNRLLNQNHYDPLQQHLAGGQMLLAPHRDSWQQLSEFFK